jgi:hypothetical protein
MKLKDIGEIHSGYITRGKIEASGEGSHFLIQTRDLDGQRLSYRMDKLLRFNPVLSRTDVWLEEGDLLFLAKGPRNITVQVKEPLGPTLAAASFFIIRPTFAELLPEYICWYLNQRPVAQYLVQHSGRGVHVPVVRRAVLENTEIPAPPVATQIKIIDMNALLSKEMSLLRKLARKHGELITSACLRTIRRY